jgi:hypothetical protein
MGGGDFFSSLVLCYVAPAFKIDSVCVCWPCVSVLHHHDTDTCGYTKPLLFS